MQTLYLTGPIHNLQKMMCCKYSMIIRYNCKVCFNLQRNFTITTHLEYRALFFFCFETFLALKTTLCHYHKFSFLIHNTSVSSQLTNVPNKLECYLTRVQKGSPGIKTLAYWVRFVTYKKMKCCKYCTIIRHNYKVRFTLQHSFTIATHSEYRTCIHNASVSLQLTNVPNKLECYLTRVQKGSPGIKTLAYWVCFVTYKK